MMLLTKVANDVMFAHCAVGTTSQPKATSLGEADITCPQGQTSFGAPALSQVAVRQGFFLTVEDASPYSLTGGSILINEPSYLLFAVFMV